MFSFDLFDLEDILQPSAKLIIAGVIIAALIFGGIYMSKQGKRNDFTAALPALEVISSAQAGTIINKGSQRKRRMVKVTGMSKYSGSYTITVKNGYTKQDLVIEVDETLYNESVRKSHIDLKCMSKDNQRTCIPQFYFDNPKLIPPVLAHKALFMVGMRDSMYE